MEKVAQACGGLLPTVNHVLVNEYAPGQGILSHQDGPLYAPAVAILSMVRNTPLLQKEEEEEGEEYLDPIRTVRRTFLCG
jgi:alkylated DNA repair protein alkB family protein 6